MTDVTHKIRHILRCDYSFKEILFLNPSRVSDLHLLQEVCVFPMHDEIQEVEKDIYVTVVFIS